MKLKSILFLFVSLFIFISCSKDDNPVDTSQSNALMLLKVGNQWTSNYIQYDTNGSINHIDTIIQTVIKDTAMQNEQWYFLFGTLSSPHYNVIYESYTLATNRSNGLWYMNFKNGNVYSQSAYLSLKFPASVNDSWLRPDGSTIKLIAKDVNLVNSKGISYSCYQYNCYDPSQLFYVKVYIAIGIGMIRSDTYWTPYSGTSYLSNRMELIDMTIK